jgi:DNA helicase-4
MTEIVRPEEGEVVFHPTYGRGQIKEIAQGSIFVSFYDWPGMYVFTIDDYRRRFQGTSEPKLKADSKSVIELPDRAWIKSVIANNYLKSEEIILERYEKLISRNEISELQLNWVASKFDVLKTDTPDEDQLRAIGATEKRVLVTARAGSGKTRTIVNRAIFLNEFCNVDPSEILILAFNRTAAAEVLSRLTSFSPKFEKCHVMTFHALAYGIVHPEEALLIDNTEQQGSKILAVESIVKNLLEDREFSDDIMSVMLSFFRTDWHTVKSGGWHLLNDKEQFLNFRRGLSNESMRGETIKSLGEKIIADFLFQHDFDYKYEKYFKWDRPYRPDFTIELGEDQGVIIEYFGMRGNPQYDSEIIEKQDFWANKPGWKLLSYYPEDLNLDSLEDLEHRIITDLTELGLNVKRLSDEEIWKRIENRGTYQFTITTSNAISKIRKRNLSAEQFKDFVDAYIPQDAAEFKFLKLLVRIFSKYMEFLERSDHDDFDGLVNRGVQKIEEDMLGFVRKKTQGNLGEIRFIFVDEFQDFSEQFFRIIDSILKKNIEASLFCVGDDWQAINSFAGSELKYFTSYSEYLGEVKKYTLVKNYRSGASIVELSNRVMEGLGLPSLAESEALGSIRLAELKRRNISASEDLVYKGDRLAPALTKMLIQLGGKFSVAVLGHNRVSIPYYVRIGEQRGSSLLDRFGEKVKSMLPPDLSKKVLFSTIHGFKGNEADVVILLDPIERSFPSIHHTWRLQRIFGVTHEALEEEELRLFYVALTRAAKHLVLICNESKELTPFLSKNSSIDNLQPIDWSRIDDIGIDEIIVTVSSKGFGTRNISAELKAAKYFYRVESKSWTKYLSAEGFNLQSLQLSSWGGKADDVSVTIDYPDGLTSATWRICNGTWIQEPLD